MKFLLVLFVAVAFLAMGQALECYQCNSRHAGCDEPFDKSGSGVRELVCGQGNYCMKIVTKTPDGSLYMLRNCTTNPNICKANAGYTTECEICSTNFCNGVSSSLNGAALSTLSVLVVSLIFGHYYLK